MISLLLEMCALLLKYKADMRLKSPTEGTALHMAARSRAENVIKLFLEQVKYYY